MLKNTIGRILLVAIGFFVPIFVCADVNRQLVTLEWVARSDYGYALDIAVDPAKNVYITGEGGSPNEYYLTIKYDSLGNELWRAQYSGPGNQEDRAVGLGLDQQGNVYVTGYSWGGTTQYDIVTIKYDSLGQEEWHRVYNGPENHDDKAYDLAVDSVGNVYITGYTAGSTYNDFLTIKYNTNGVVQWLAQYNGPADGIDNANALTIDRDGNVYVAGYSDVDPTWDSENDYSLVKYNAAGVLQWTATYNGPGNAYDEAKDIVVDAFGNVYITGRSEGWGTNWDFATVKYNSFGEEEWAARYNGLGNWDDEGYSLAVDDEGNVFVTGWSRGGPNGDDYATIKYDGSGVEQWVRRYNGPDNNTDEPSELVLDPSGNVYVTGFVCTQGAQEDFATVKYHNSGCQLWDVQYDSGNTAGYANAITIDDELNIYVTGSSSYYYTTVKYSQQLDFPNMNVSLIPLSTPIQIPASGGSFDYELFITNNEDTSQTISIWAEAILPDGSTYELMAQPYSLTIAPGAIGWCRTQNIPAKALPGNYSYHVLVGEYPDEIWDAASFPFSKLPVGTQVSGPVSGIWDPMNNPYILTGNIWIPENETLIILPGVDIDWLATGTQFDCYGRLEANGVQANHINMQSGTNTWLMLNLHGTGVNADILQYVDLNGKITMTGADHNLESVNLYYAVGNLSMNYGILGPADDVNISDCTIDIHISNSYPTAVAYAHGISQIDGMIENCFIDVYASNSNYEMSAASSYGMEDCSGIFANNEILTEAHASGIWSVATAYGIYNCNGLKEKNYIYGESWGSVRGIYGGSGDIINNTLYLSVPPGYSYARGISGSGMILNNILQCSNNVGIGITGGSVVNFNTVFGFAAPFDSLPINNYCNYVEDPLISSGILQPNSPCINRGDPNPIYNDPDGSRDDRGWKPFDPGNGANLVASQNEIDFGTVQVGSYADVTVTFTNIGQTAGEISFYTCPEPPYAVVSGVPSGPILPGESVDITIRFAPLVPGSYDYNEISFSGSIPPYHIVLNGQGF